MKGGKYGSHKEIVQQLKGAKCLIAYCRAIGQIFWDRRNFLKEKDYEQRFISIKNIRLPKKQTRREKGSARHDKPENMRRLDRSRLQFNELTGNP